MMNTNSILAAVNDLQPDAQARLPVIPRNGNPQGANNMPAAAPAVDSNGAKHYPWLDPSPNLDILHDWLKQPLRRNYPDAQTPQAPQQNPPPFMPSPTIPAPVVMPYRTTAY